MVLGKITWWSMPVSSSTSSRTFGSYAPTCTSSVVHVCRTCASSDFVPSFPMTAPAAKMPIGVWSKTQWVCPSITSTCGTRSLYFAGARDVNMSAGSDQCESASTTSMFSVAMIGTVTPENLIHNSGNQAHAASGQRDLPARGGERRTGDLPGAVADRDVVRRSDGHGRDEEREDGGRPQHAGCGPGAARQLT